MYGMIHKAAQGFVTEAHGKKVWRDILDEAGLDDEHFISGQCYDDAITLNLLSVIASKTNTRLADLLEAFGLYWVRYTQKTSYAGALRMAGPDAPTFIANLDNIHLSVKASMPEAVLPSFEVTENKGRILQVAYRSERNGLEPFVKGLLLGILDRFSEAGEITYETRDDCVLYRIERIAKTAAA